MSPLLIVGVGWFLVGVFVGLGIAHGVALGVPVRRKVKKPS